MASGQTSNAVEKTGSTWGGGSIVNSVKGSRSDQAVAKTGLTTRYL